MNGFKELKDTVIDQQLCCFCGTCIGVCPSEYIGYKDEDIVNNDKKKCIDCKMCIKVCPGKDFDYMGMNEKLFNRTYCGSLTGGGYINIYKGTANIDVDVSSGGFATSIALYLLENNMIDGVVGVVQHGRDVSVEILKSKDDVLRAAQSKYVFIPVNKIIREINKYSGSFLFIGLPCQIQGIRKASDIHKKLAAKVYMYISVFCGFNMSIAATDFLINKSQIPYENIEKIEYRGRYKKQTGFKITDKYGKIFFISKHGYTILNAFYSKERCWKCYDYTGEFADISIGDAWEIERGSRIITRNQCSEDIIKEMERKGLVRVEPSSEDDIYNTQRKIVNYKKYHIAERLKILKHIPNNNIEFKKMSLKDRISALFFTYFLFFGQTKIARKLLYMIPLNMLSTISIKLRRTNCD